MHRKSISVKNNGVETAKFSQAKLSLFTVYFVNYIPVHHNSNTAVHAGAAYW